MNQPILKLKTMSKRTATILSHRADQLPESAISAIADLSEQPSKLRRILDLVYRVKHVLRSSLAHAHLAYGVRPCFLTSLLNSSARCRAAQRSIDKPTSL